MVVFFVWIIGLLGTLVLAGGALTYVVVTLTYRRPCPIHVPAGMLSGYVAGALFVWTLVPRDWALPFWTTLAAAGNAEKYGHALEHEAEAIVIWILFGAVAGSVAGGSLAHIAGNRPGPRTITQAR
jgi:hypothetical protein